MLIDQKLISLLKIIETGSFTKAADSLCITQPAVSQQIKLLEEELDTKIFLRSHNDFRLTPDGELVVEYARRLSAVSDGLIQAIRDEKTKVSSVVVGITHTVESSVFIEVVAGYAKEHNGLTVKVVADSAENLYKKMKNYELDFIIVSDRLQDPSLCYYSLESDSLELIVSPLHQLASRKSVSIEDIKKEHYILRTTLSDTRRLLSKSMKKANHSIDELDVALELDNIATIKDLIRRDFGVSILAKSSCMDEILKGKLVSIPIDNLNLQRDINIACLQDCGHKDIIEGIVDFYKSMK